MRGARALSMDRIVFKQALPSLNQIDEKGDKGKRNRVSKRPIVLRQTPREDEGVEFNSDDSMTVNVLYNEFERSVLPLQPTSNIKYSWLTPRGGIRLSLNDVGVANSHRTVPLEPNRH